ncbi:MAG: tetratricopeptide repeat protein, partial [Deltaproteobacteria bacterium]|nr:tetratricopeptide repeat protein [Deltaproteobacteria bacterium]
KAEALIAAGQPAAAKALIAPAKALGENSSYKPLLARAHYLGGRAASARLDYAAAFAAYRDGYYAARAGRDPATATACASAAALSLLDLSRDPEAVEWAKLAEAEAGAGGDPRLDAQVHGALAAVTKDAKVALGYADRCVAYAAQQTTRPHTEAYRQRAELRDKVGDVAGALADLDEGERRVRAMDGDELDVAVLERERALYLTRVRRTDDAIAAARRGLAIAERVAGPDSPATIDAIGVLAMTLKEAERYEEALPLFERAIAHDEPGSYNLASDLNNRADLDAAMGNLDQALATWEQARAMFAAITGEASYEVGMVALNVWNGLYRAGRPVGPAAPHAALAVKVFAATPEASTYAQALIALGTSELENGDAAHAAQHLADGLGKIGDDAGWRLRARLGLARLEPARAKELLAAARADAVATKQPDRVKEIDALLARLQ